MENSRPILSDFNRSENTNKTSSRLGLCVNTNTVNSPYWTGSPGGRWLSFSPPSLLFPPSVPDILTPSHTRVYSLWSIPKLHFGLQTSELGGPVSRCGVGSMFVFHRAHQCAPPFKPTPTHGKRLRTIGETLPASVARACQRAARDLSRCC